MIITFLKEDLLEKLYPSMVAVSNKSTIAETEGVMMETMPGGILRLTTYDLQKGVRSYIENVTIEEEGRYIIGAARLLQILKVMPDHSDITISVDEKLAVKVESGKSSFSLFAMKCDGFPMLPDLSGDLGFTIPSGTLRKMILKTIHSVSSENTRPALCGAFFTFNRDSLEVVSCDSFTLSKCSTKCEMTSLDGKDAFAKPMKMIIPGHALGELVRMLGDNDNPVMVYMGVKHAIFHIDGVIFFTRLIDGNYIDYERILPKEQTVFVNADRERLLAGLERAMLIAGEKHAGSGRSFVKLIVKENSLIMTSTSVSGKISDEMEVEHEGEDIEINFNCRYLISSISAADSEKVVITMKSANHGLTVEPLEKSEEKDFFYFVLPLRTNEQ